MNIYTIPPSVLVHTSEATIQDFIFAGMLNINDKGVRHDTRTNNAITVKWAIVRGYDASETVIPGVSEV